MPSERMQILITSDQRRRLRAEAKRRGTSVASLVREAVDERFASVDPESRLRALEEIKAMRGRDLSADELDRIAEEEHEQSPLPGARSHA